MDHSWKSEFRQDKKRCDEMRIRTTEQPPESQDIQRILKEGASKDDQVRFKHLLRRMRNAFFIDSRNRPLSCRERLIAQYKKDGLVLFLGAGVSAESGIPGWPTLAAEVLSKSGISPQHLKEVRREFPSLITQFQLAQQRFACDREFVEAIYQGLYGQMKCKRLFEKIPRKYEEQRAWTGWGGILKCLQSNKTLAAVGDLLIDPTGSRMHRNAQVHAVLTVNADNLLELYCEAKCGGKRIVTLVDRASVGDHPDQTSVHHLHGTLDARGENFSRPAPRSVSAENLQNLSDDLLPDLVFSESAYYGTIANPASFVNHTPQSFFSRLNFLFIGTSLDDLNIRRWLSDSFKERVQHRTKYLREFYWKTYRDADYEAKLESLRHFWFRVPPQSNARLQDTIELVMKNLGVAIVWGRDFVEIQSLIREIQRLGYDSQFGRRAADYPS